MGEVGTLPWKLLRAGRFEPSRLEQDFNVVSEQQTSQSSRNTLQKEACLKLGVGWLNIESQKKKKKNGSALA